MGPSAVLGQGSAAERFPDHNQGDRESTPTSGPVGPIAPGGRAEADEARFAADPTLARHDAADAALLAEWNQPMPPVVLVVAPGSVGRWLEATSAPAADAASQGPGLDVHCSEDPGSALELARALAPDVVVIDADVAGAQGLIEALAGGPLTGATPLVALGSWESPEQAAPLVGLGVARCLVKPVSPGTLRRACLELARNPAVRRFERLGQTTLEGLGARLADELGHGLCAAADEQTRALPVDLGDGTEIRAALWGAIARIRELVTAGTDGRIRFVPTGPEGALPAASWLTSGPVRSRADRTVAGQEIRRSTERRSLAGHTILVAEDDLSVNWFLGGVLREAGATVLDARDGTRALALAYRHVPDLVISDILMPGLDGFALCRAVKRDVVLRDVPVILLSWKEDLLQRVRELGVGAEGYLRKEASGATVVRRVVEVLRGRSALRSRLATGGPVRGRLDGLTAYALLHLVCRHRPDARLSVRDASSLYEIEIRHGRPVGATWSGVDGESDQGPAVLGALLGVVAARFGVDDADEPVPEQLEGTLDEQLLEPMAAARAAHSLLAGPALLRVERACLEPEFVAAALGASPEPVRELLRALDRGASPRALLQEGRASTELLESVLGDAARHGAVTAVLLADETDALPAARARELRLLECPNDATAARECMLAAVQAVSHFDPAHASGPGDGGSSVDLAEICDLDEVAADLDIEERSDASHAVAEALSVGRSSSDTPPHGGDAERHTPILTSGLAVLPSARRAMRAPAEASARQDVYAASARWLDPEADGHGVGGSRPNGAEGARGSAVEPAVPAPPLASGPSSPASAASAPAAGSPAAGEAQKDAAPPHEVPLPSAYTPTRRKGRTGRSKSRRSRLLVPVLFGITGVGLAIGARWVREHQTGPAAPAVVAPLVPSEPAVALPALPAPAQPAPASGTATPADDAAAQAAASEQPTEFPLSKDDAVAKGEGVLEVVAGKSDEIFVNGQLMGKGPVVKVTLKAVADPYEIRVKLRGEERVRYALVKDGKRVRLRIAPPWTR